MHALGCFKDKDIQRISALKCLLAETTTYLCNMFLVWKSIWVICSRRLDGVAWTFLFPGEALTLLVIGLIVDLADGEWVWMDGVVHSLFIEPVLWSSEKFEQ